MGGAAAPVRFLIGQTAAAGFPIHVPGLPRMRSGAAGRVMAGAMAAATGGDSDGDSEELVLTPAQLIQSLEQVPGLQPRAGLVGLCS